LSKLIQLEDYRNTMLESTPGCRIALETRHAVRDEAFLNRAFFLRPSLGMSQKKCMALMDIRCHTKKSVDALCRILE